MLGRMSAGIVPVVNVRRNRSYGRRTAYNPIYLPAEELRRVGHVYKVSELPLLSGCQKHGGRRYLDRCITCEGVSTAT